MVHAVARSRAVVSARGDRLQLPHVECDRGRCPRPDPYLEEHIAQKKAIYFRYKEGLKDLPVSMNPYLSDAMEPNFWLSCLLIDPEAMCKQVRSDSDACYVHEKGRTCPTEILEKMAAANAEGRPIWKPMHMQPFFRMNPFVTRDGDGRARTNAYIAGGVEDVGADIFARGLCLPSDNKMNCKEQEMIIQIIRSCFEKSSFSGKIKTLP